VGLPTLHSLVLHLCLQALRTVI